MSGYDTSESSKTSSVVEENSSSECEEIFRDSDDEDIEQQTDVPNAIELNTLIVGIHCHPKRNIVAAGTVEGPIHMYSFAKDSGNAEILHFDHHKKPCRAVKFSSSGDYLFSGSQDTTICVVDLESNSVYRKFCRPDGSAIYSLLPIDNYLLASGEEDGPVVIWDFRMQAPVACFEESNDYISSLSINDEKRILLATSSEGTLLAYNVRSKKLEAQSELFDSEFLSSGIIKEGSKIVVGTGNGALNIFNWGEYGNISDRFPGHPGSVDCMVVFSDDVIFTGCEDGRVRAVQLFPTRFLGSLGSHSGFSVDSLSVSYDSTLLASSSFDQKIKFWDLSGIEDAQSEDVKNTKKKHQQLNRQINNFFADLE